MKQLLLGASPFQYRLLTKQALETHTIWFDVLYGRTDRIVIAEAVKEALDTPTWTAQAIWSGVRITLVGGKPYGKVQEAHNFAWDNRNSDGIWS